ncbi:MAG: hypothetical protein JNK75_14145 [Betaproteobacteria bacterium]|nr:hypothetical protein [Betaproteobacteria bacterium]
MKRTRSGKHSASNLSANAKRTASAGTQRDKRRKEIHAAWAMGISAAILGIGSAAHFLTSAGPPFQGRGAALANALHALFGPIGPALPWLGIAAVLGLLALSAARGWGE